MQRHSAGRITKRKFQKNKAVALKYDEQKDIAPVIVATGNGYLAEKIIESAEKHGIPVHKDESTATLLSQLELGSRVPDELFHIIATIYAHIMDASNKRKGKREEKS